MERREVFKVAAGAAAALSLTGNSSPARSQGRTCKGSSHITTPDGTRLFVRNWGEGTPVLFLAGWTLPSDFWGYQMVELARLGFQVIGYDRRGHGRSSDPGRGYDHDTLADDLATVIEQFGLEDVTLVGHSMAGTEIARYFARHGGERIARILLAGTITPFLMKTSDNPIGLDKHLLAQLREPLSRDFPGWIDENAGPFFVPETSLGMVEWGKGLMLQTSLLAAIELAHLNAETDFRDDLRKVTVPTLLIHGTKDASAPLPLTAKATAKLIPNASLVIYEGAPHGLPLTHGARLKRDLVNFVRNVQV